MREDGAGGGGVNKKPRERKRSFESSCAWRPRSRRSAASARAERPDLISSQLDTRSAPRVAAIAARSLRKRNLSWPFHREGRIRLIPVNCLVVTRPQRRRFSRVIAEAGSSDARGARRGAMEIKPADAPSVRSSRCRLRGRSGAVLSGAGRRLHAPFRPCVNVLSGLASPWTCGAARRAGRRCLANAARTTLNWAAAFVFRSNARDYGRF